eukprot:jgi/Mesvir1/10976/Mv26471-RA.1
MSKLLDQAKTPATASPTAAATAGRVARTKGVALSGHAVPVLVSNMLEAVLPGMLDYAESVGGKSIRASLMLTMHGSSASGKRRMLVLQMAGILDTMVTELGYWTMPCSEVILELAAAEYLAKLITACQLVDWGRRAGRGLRRQCCHSRRVEQCWRLRRCGRR